MLLHLKKYQALYSVFFILIAVSTVLYYYPPDQVVEYIGVENSYLATFLIAAFGGLSSVTSGVFYAAVATFSSGGASPWLLGLIGGIGIAIGDSIIFGLFTYGVKGLSDVWEDRVEQIRTHIERYPDYAVYVGLFLILGVSPLPNDIVMFALVVLGFKYVKIAPILVLAGISVTTITALLGESLSSYIF